MNPPEISPATLQQQVEELKAFEGAEMVKDGDGDVREDAGAETTVFSGMCDGPDELFRLEALYRLLRNNVIGNYDNGGGVRNCIVPADAVDKNGQIIPSKNTYRQVRIAGRNYGVHDAVLTLIHDRFLQPGEVGMHVCNNPVCRNPIHLLVGNPATNARYASMCRRTATGERNGHSTQPERTPRGDFHYRTMLKGEQRRVALELLKKYNPQRGSRQAIAEYLGVARGVIDYLVLKGEHLDPEVQISTIELSFRKWVPKSAQKRPQRPDPELYVRSIRQQFHDTPEHERATAIASMALEYGFCTAWIRKILNRSVHPNVARDIPLPTSFGIGSRKAGKKKGEMQA